jgi:hypothetical protein
MTEFPKDGSTFVVEVIDRTAYRWAKYKTGGSRQWPKPGRWQKQVWAGDYFKWENCEEPVGELSPLVEDGPISKAFREAEHLNHGRHEVGKLSSQVEKLRYALGMIAAPRDCGCSPTCQCDDAGALKVEIDYLKDVARAVLRHPEENANAL